MHYKPFLTLLLGAFLCTANVHAQTAPNPTASKTTTLPLLDPNVSIFYHLAKTANIVELFEGTGPFTGFIPNNAAFQKLGTKKLNDLIKTENHDQLVDLLTYHVIPGKYMSRTLKAETLKTINGKNVNVILKNGKIQVNNATVVRTDMVGPNGVFHEIDTVLFP